MPVGTFPGLADMNRMTTRAPVNPLDKTTIVSIYPKEIHQFNATIQPGDFVIPSGNYEKPSVLVVGPSSWWKELDEQQPLLEIPVSSIQIADSVIRDYSNGLLACNMGDHMPGLFYIPGEHPLIKIKTEFKSLLDKAAAKQKNWYTLLVKLADALWSRTNGNPLSISDDMRFAAKELALPNKPWMEDFHMVQMVQCIACGALRNPMFPVCQTCKAIADPTKAKELNLQFAQ